MRLRRIVSALTAFAITFTAAVPGLAYADETSRNTGGLSELPETEGNYEFEDTNSLGVLLSQKAEEKTEETSISEDCRIISLEKSGSIVKIKYTALMDCKVVVTINDDSTGRMLRSASTGVSAEDFEAELMFSEDDFPEYFVIKAYLVDAATLSPLSKVCENENYTEKMQEFLSKTTDDFDDERVLNFDDDKTNNFAVFDEDVIVVEPVSGYDKVTKCDYRNNIYTIENADDTLLSVKSGDMIAYNFGGEDDIIIVKADNVAIDGDTVTIKGTDTCIEEVFEYVKIDKELDLGDTELSTEGIENVVESDFSNLDHSEDYPMPVPEPQPSPNNSGKPVEIENNIDLKVEQGKAEVSWGLTVKVELAKKEKEFKQKNDNVKITTDFFKGTFTFNPKSTITLSFSKKDKKGSEFDVGKDSKNIDSFEFKWDFSFIVDGEVSVSADVRIPVFKMKTHIVHGFTLVWEPSILLSASAKVILNGTISKTFGLKISDGKTENTSEPLKIVVEPKIEGEVSIGIDLGPSIQWIIKELFELKFELSAKAIAKVTLEMPKLEIGGTGAPKDKHDCVDFELSDKPVCCKGRVDEKFTIGATGKLLSSDKLKVKIEASDTKQVADFYHSFYFGDYDWTTCPHKHYNYTITVNDLDGEPIPEAIVTYDAQEYKTDEKGEVLLYFTPGSNYIDIKKDEHEPISHKEYKVEVSKKQVEKVSVKGSNNQKPEFSFATTAEMEDVVKINGDEARSDTVVLNPVTYTVLIRSITDEYGRSVKSDFKTDYKHFAPDGVTSVMRFPKGTWTITALPLEDVYKPCVNQILIDGSADVILFDMKLEHRYPPVAFRLKDRYGNKITNASLKLESLEDESQINVEEIDDYMCWLPEGSYRFTAEKKGCERICFEFDSDGINEQTFDITMGSDYKTQLVRVADPKGKLIPYADVTSISNKYAAYQTDLRGIAEVLLPAGEHTIKVECNGYIANEVRVSIPDSDEKIEPVTIVLEEGPIVGKCGKSVKWELWEGTLTISGFGEMYNFSQEDTPWYSLAEKIERIVIKDGVTCIGDWAFDFCQNVTSVEIPDSVTRIGAKGFWLCISLETITLPESITSIGESAFFSCMNLEKIVIPDTITEIPGNMCKDCFKLKSVKLSDKTESIGYGAFEKCKELTEISFPKTLKRINKYAFDGCEELKDVYFDGSETKWHEIVIADNNEPLKKADKHFKEMLEVDGKCGDDVFWELTEDTLRIYGSGEMYSWNDDMSQIPWRDYTENIKNIIIEEGVTSIGGSAFYVMRNLVSVEIADSVEVIGDGAFSSCLSLETVNIPGNVKTIGKSAFSSCVSLTSIALPASVETIGEGAFRTCKKMTSITMTNNVKTIGSGAFNGCESLKSIKLPNGLTKIESNLFDECYSLTAIDIPEGVKEIDDYAFASCTGLKTLSIPKTVTWIGKSVFYHCDVLSDVYYSGTKEQWNNICFVDSESSLYLWLYKADIHYSDEKIIDSGECGDDAFWELSGTTLRIYGTGEIRGVYRWEKDPSIQKIIIKDGITSIGDQAFREVKYAETIEIPDSITSIGEYAFYYCTSLTSINLPDSITSIGDRAFDHCTALPSINLPINLKSISWLCFGDCSNLLSIEIPEGVTEIGMDAFKNCISLTSVKLPDSLEKLCSGAFENCKALEEIEIPNGVTEIIDTFEGCEYLATVKLPDNLIKIGSYTFLNCYSLSSITLPESLEYIGEKAFYCCNSLTYVDIPDSVEQIGEGAFGYCDGLTSVRLSSGLTETSVKMFEYCRFLNSIIIPEGVTIIKPNTFHRCRLLKTIILPKSLKTIAQTAFYEGPDAPDIYYAGTEEEWNEIFVGGYNDSVSNATVHYNSAAAPTPSPSPSTRDIPSEAVEKRATFNELRPNTVYNFYSMRSRNADEPLSDDNLLYIGQYTSNQNGVLLITYFPKADYEDEELFVREEMVHISAAEVSLSEEKYKGMGFTEEAALSFGGEELIEGKDYNITGEMFIPEPGTYSFLVNGIGRFYGEQLIVYNVVCEHSYKYGTCTICGSKCEHDYDEDGVCSECGYDKNAFRLGDIDGDGKISAYDASLVLTEYTLRSSNKGSILEEDQFGRADIDGDGKVSAYDASLILSFYTYLAGKGTASNITEWMDSL